MDYVGAPAEKNNWHVDYVCASAEKTADMWKLVLCIVEFLHAMPAVKIFIFLEIISIWNFT